LTVFRLEKKGLEVCPYFVAFYDKIEAHREAIPIVFTVTKIVSSMSSMFVAFYGKIEATGGVIYCVPMNSGIALRCAFILLYFATKI
jgi:hypothetical protein